MSIAAPPSTAAEAVAMLRAADAFEDEHVGYGGQLSRYHAALRIVRDDSNARALFSDLADNGTPAGRLYGVAGLYLTDSAAYETALARVVAEPGSVSTTHGCRGMEEPIAAVARTIPTTFAGSAR